MAESNLPPVQPPDPPNGAHDRAPEGSPAKKISSLGQQEWKVPGSGRRVFDEQPLMSAMRRFWRQSGLAEQYAIKRLLDNWPEAVGETVAKHTAKVGYQKGVVTVYVHSPAWRQELDMRKSGRLAHLNHWAGQPIVKTIEIRLA